MSKRPMRVCVYCAASANLADHYVAAARELGDGIAQRGWSLIYGGGGVGLMGTLAKAVRAGGGEVVGIIPQALLDRERAYLQADELIVTTTLRERKQLMDDHSDAFISLPGGFGTLEETLEILTLRQLAYHDKPVIIVNIGGYFDPLLGMFEQIFDQGFAHTQHRDLYSVAPSSAAALELLAER
ncbi:MAG TPA: TIGR00730 family Rossman fold protein [Roseiflexaceae bacterium]|nr:TIGR00730 family Rossman fold protein [Roseiflexaceae bacterium]